MPLALTTKSRPIMPKSMKGTLVTTQYRYKLPPLAPVTTRAEILTGKVKGMQITASENHPGWADASPMDGDVGGPFSSDLSRCDFGGSMTLTGSTVDKDGVGYTAVYQGPCIACDPSQSYFQWPSPTVGSDAVLKALGTKAIAIVKPTNSIADAATALIELYREGLPKMVGSALWKEKTSKARRKAAGGEYLNIEFGWKPLVGDIQDVYKAIKTSDAVMKQYERDAGKVVRRKFEYPSVETASTKTVLQGARGYTPVGSSILLKDGGAVSGALIQTDQLFQRTWFSGAFTYHLPGDWYKRGSSSKMDALLGTDITPAVVWNITPWSWFADWFANTGDVISNLTDMAQDGLVLRYGYIMQHTRAVRTYSYVGSSPYQCGAIPTPITLTVESKRRLRSSPYGFGITWQGFSPRQLAILAALGISR
jgi:hypothetical protein